MIVTATTVWEKCKSQKFLYFKILNFKFTWH